MVIKPFQIERADLLSANDFDKLFADSKFDCNKLDFKEVRFMAWYKNMTEQQKKDFKKVIIVCAAGTVMGFVRTHVFSFCFLMHDNFQFFGINRCIRIYKNRNPV